MSKEFREGVVSRADKALGWIDDYFSGKMADPGKINQAIKMVGFGIKVVHMDQIKDQGDKSLAVRLMKFLPSDEARQKYIAVTHPEAKPYLLDRPKKG